MWLFLNDSFLSIVADRNSDKLLVRARLPGDIERAFPGSEVVEGAGTDYRFRTWLAREVVADRLTQEAMSLAYTNFKSSVTQKDRHIAYMKVWSIMSDWQGCVEATERAAGKPARR